MRHFLAVLLLVLAVTACGGDARGTLKNGRPISERHKALLIEELVTLARSDMSEGVQVEWARRISAPVALTVEEIIRLKKAGVGERVIRILIKGTPVIEPLE